jgi:hypothetical protein
MKRMAEVALGPDPRVASRSSTVGGFALRTLAWLPVAFFIWYFTAAIILYPAVLIIRGLASVSHIVRTVEQSGSVVTFITTLKASTVASGAVVTVDVNLLLYSFGLPLLAALTLATRERAWKQRLAIGYAVLLPCIAASVFADFLKNVAHTAGPAVAAQAGFTSWEREAIAFAYQFGALILPTVAPAVVWVAMHGGFLSSLRRNAG